MPTYFVSAAGADANNGTTWALAKSTFAGAIAVANASGDIIAVDATNPPADIAANTTWTFLNHISVIASTNSGVSTVTPAIMGDADWLGAAGNFSITLAGVFRVYFYGITFRMGATGSLTMALNSSDGAHYEFDNCYFWISGNSTGARISTGAIAAGANSYTLLKNCTFRFGIGGQAVVPNGFTTFEGGSIATAGSAPTVFFVSANNNTGVVCEGFNFSHIGAGTLVGNNTGSPTEHRFSRCRFGAGMTVMATQTITNKSSARVFVFDCHAGNTHMQFQYRDAFGTLTISSSIFVTTGAAGVSWEVVTTANCSFATPFVTPWIDLYHTGTSAITPYIEILRNDSATAFTDAQVWGEFSVKDNAGFVTPDFFNDRQSLTDFAAGTAGVNQAAGDGLGAWTGESGTAWSGRVNSGSAVTPAEVGHIRGRVCVAGSRTVYVDRQIRF